MRCVDCYVYQSRSKQKMLCAIVVVCSTCTSRWWMGDIFLFSYYMEYLSLLPPPCFLIFVKNVLRGYCSFQNIVVSGTPHSFFCRGRYTRTLTTRQKKIVPYRKLVACPMCTSHVWVGRYFLFSCYTVCSSQILCCVYFFPYGRHFTIVYSLRPDLIVI